MSVIAMTTGGYALWCRRQTWRMMPHDSVLTLGILLQGIGFFLCFPPTGRLVGQPFYFLTGITHFRDYIGHCCFFSAIGCIIYAAVCRLLPDDEVRRWMRRVEISGAIAAPIMLLALVSSPRTKHPHVPYDFFSLPCDGWLDLYWLVLSVHCAYLTVLAIWALSILRGDPRSRCVADAYIAAGYTNLATVLCLMTATIGHHPGLVPCVWALLGMAGTLCTVGSYESWCQRARFLRPIDPDQFLREADSDGNRRRQDAEGA